MKHLLILAAIFATSFTQAQKKHFQPVDQHFILQKIAKTTPGTWSLTENSNIRHYGLTDKEFFKNFGNDRVGKIGNETRVENYDKIGLNYVAIHALIIEKKQLKAQLKQTNDELESLKTTVDALNKKIEVLEKYINKQSKPKKEKTKKYGTN